MVGEMHEDSNGIEVTVFPDTKNGNVPDVYVDVEPVGLPESSNREPLVFTTVKYPEITDGNRIIQLQATNKSLLFYRYYYSDNSLGSIPFSKTPYGTYVFEFPHDESEVTFTYVEEL